MDIEKLKGFDCPLEATLAMIGGKYKILIVYTAMDNLWLELPWWF